MFWNIWGQLTLYPYPLRGTALTKTILHPELFPSFGASFSYILILLRNAKMLDLVKSDPSMPDEEVTVEYVLKNLCIIGDQKSCIEQLEELWEVTGGFGTLLMIKHDFDDLPRWRQCIQMLTNDIVPALPSIDTEMGV